MLNGENIGVKWIREIELYLNKRPVNPSSCNRCIKKEGSHLRQANLTVRLMLELLPRDQLEIFRWHPWEPFGADSMALLLRKQKNLKWFGAIGLDKDWDEKVEKRLDLRGSLNRTRKLGLYPDGMNTMKFCNALLRNVQPEQITIHCSFHNHASDIDEDDVSDSGDNDDNVALTGLNDTPTEAGLLTRTLFSHMVPFETCKPMQLTRLTLEDVNLRYCTNTYCKVIDFTKLRKLTIVSCKSSDAMLAALCHNTRLPERLEKLEFKNDDDGTENEVSSALETFLCLAIGIKILTINVCNADKLPSAVSIIRHGKTLETLNCHAWRQRSNDILGPPWHERIWDVESIVKITKACKRLEQLSIGFPLTYIGRKPSDDYAQFSSAVACLPYLKTLNITTWPQNRIGSSSAQLSRKVYTQLLCSQAQEAFEISITNAAMKKAEQEADKDLDPNEPRWTSSKLRVIAIGGNDKVYDRDDSTTVDIFVRGESLDPLGGPNRIHASKLNPLLVQYYEPDADVLEDSLMHSQGPPTREADPDDSWD